jgi:hypothetical protein
VVFGVGKPDAIIGFPGITFNRWLAIALCRIAGKMQVADGYCAEVFGFVNHCELSDQGDQTWAVFEYANCLHQN